MDIKTFKQMLKASFKSDDTEETIDVYFTRPIGLAFALLCRKLKVTPNMVTYLSMVLGIASGVMFYYTDLTHNIIGILLLMMANFCDSTDGQLARMTGQKTLIGRMLDGFSGDVWFVAIYFAIVFRIWNDPIPFTDINWEWWGLLMCAVAGIICHSKQCSLSDYYRQIHLYFLLGKEGSELDDSVTQKAIYDNLPEKGAFWDHKFYFNYYHYCRSQESRTPNFQRFYKAVKEKYPNATDMPQQLRDDFRKGSLPLMKFTNLQTFNFRAITLYISCLIGMPYIYPIVEITVMSGMYHYMHIVHERLSKRLYIKYFESAA